LRFALCVFGFKDVQEFMAELKDLLKAAESKAKTGKS